VELARRGAEVGYVRTPNGFEVDFLVRYPEGRQELIQVCASLDDPGTRAREIRGLLDAALEFPRASLMLIGIDIPEVMAIPSAITVFAARDWLLAEKSAGDFSSTDRRNDDLGGFIVE